MTGWKKEYILDEMTWEQVKYYYNIGWETEQTKAKVHWGTYGSLMSKSSSDNVSKPNSKTPIEEMRQYPGYENAYYDEKGKFHKE